MIVKDARRQGFILDYSIRSLAVVDELLSSLHKEYSGLGESLTIEQQQSYEGYAQMLGCYMLAVVDKNNIPGRLTTLDDEYGQGVGFTFESGATCDFISWCQKAIANGRDEAIEPKFKMFLDN